MPFFTSPFFATEHFKAPFYGEPFFSEPFFDETTISHGLSAGTTSSTEVTVVGSRVVTGTLDPLDFSITIDGIEATVTGAVATVNSIAVTITETILAGEVLTLSHRANPLNNVGILIDEPVVNDVV